MITDEELYKIFGQNIQEFRLERNMTIEELSQITSIKTQYFKKLKAELQKD